MKRVHVPVPLFFLLALAGCATTAGPSGAGESAPDVEGADAQMRVFFSSACPVSGATKEGALGVVALSVASDVVGKLVGSGIDALGNYLSSERAISFSEATRVDGFVAAKQGVALYNTKISCMVIVVAKNFGGPKPDKYMPVGPLAQTQALTDEIYNVTKLSGPALFYMEMALHFNTHDSTKISSTAFTYVPRLFYYPAFITPGSWRYSRTRDVLLKVELLQPGQTSAFGTFDWQWDGVSSGAIAAESVLSHAVPWSPLPDGLSAAAEKVTAGETATQVYPVNVKVMLTETAKPHTILKYIGESLVAQKSTITDAATATVNQAFSEQARIEVRQAAAADVGKKYDDYVAAYDDAQAAQQKYAAATDATTKKKTLVAAKLSYAKLSAAEATVRIAYRSAGIGDFDPLPKLAALGAGT